MDDLLELLGCKNNSKHLSSLVKRGYNFNMYNFSPFPIKIENLPYNMDSLEPYISKETIFYHYNKHHQGYVNKLNNLVNMTKLNKDTLRLSDLLKPNILKEFPDIYNNAAQVWNHTFYWNGMTPISKPMSLNFRLLIASNFGSYDKFKKEFINIAKSHFGSGWVWLVKNIKTSKLEIIDTHDAYNPLTECKYIPLLVLDVWEHAYYLDEQNDREQYIKNWFEIINWDFVERNLKLSNL